MNSTTINKMGHYSSICVLLGMMTLGLVHSAKTQNKIDNYKSAVLAADSARYENTDKRMKGKSLCVQQRVWQEEYNSVMASMNQAGLANKAYLDGIKAGQTNKKRAYGN